MCVIQKWRKKKCWLGEHYCHLNDFFSFFLNEKKNKKFEISPQQNK